MLLVLTVSITTALLPLIIRISKPYLPLELRQANWLLPVLAGALFLTSFHLPDIHISSETSTFQQHFIGGGVYCALLYIYAKQLFALKFYWLVDVILLFAWTSTFGVANKLLEFVLLKLHVMALNTSDAYWDLLANTLGAFSVQVVWALVELVRRASRQN